MPGAGSLPQWQLRLAAAPALGAGAARCRAQILAKWIESEKIYGCARIHAALQDEGERVSRKRVARVMREMGIEGVTPRRFKTATTKRDAQARPAPDPVARDFSAEASRPALGGRHREGAHLGGMAVPCRSA